MQRTGEVQKETLLSLRDQEASPDPQAPERSIFGSQIPVLWFVLFPILVVKSQRANKVVAYSSVSASLTPCFIPGTGTVVTSPWSQRK